MINKKESQKKHPIRINNEDYLLLKELVKEHGTLEKNGNLKKRKNCMKIGNHTNRQPEKDFSFGKIPLRVVRLLPCSLH